MIGNISKEPKGQFKWAPARHIGHNWSINTDRRDFPGSPVTKNLPSNAGNDSLIPGQGTKIPQVN